MNDFLHINASIIELLAAEKESDYVFRSRFLVMSKNLLQRLITLDLISSQDNQSTDGLNVNIFDLVK